VTVRLALTDDAARLSVLHGASFHDGWSEADFRTWLSRPEAFGVLAVPAAADREWEAVAFGLALAAGDDAELLTIATASGSRRRGLGREIFVALDAQARKRGLTRWVLEVARSNLAAIGLYKSSGFVEIAVRKAYYPQGEGREDALVLSRPVGLVGRHTGG
jgi:[ribosomal protein S18]-alanine N-acetyltransferase